MTEGDRGEKTDREMGVKGRISRRKGSKRQKEDVRRPGAGHGYPDWGCLED